MTIGEILQITDKKTYDKLMEISKEKPKKIELGDSVENLMSADSHKRVKGTIRQTRWGTF